MAKTTLTITIIVLLILAGVTIATLTGDNGILEQADKAKTETTMGEEKEAIGLAYNGAKTEKLGGEITATDLNAQFTKNGTKATASGEGTIKVDFQTGKSYTIDANGTIEEIVEANQLKIGDYVIYLDGSGSEILCKVLYNNENYGVQLISVNPVDVVTLGIEDPNIPDSMSSSTDRQKVIYSYNNAIRTLNDKADTFRNPDLSPEGGARCVGSKPGAPYAEATEMARCDNYYNSYNSGKFLDADDNYVEDLAQLDLAGAESIEDASLSEGYWLASRDTEVGEGYGTDVCAWLRAWKNTQWGVSRRAWVFWAQGSDPNWQHADSVSLGLRPVFKLNQGVELDCSGGKNGSSAGLAYGLKYTGE